MTTSLYEANRIARRVDEAMNAAGDRCPAVLPEVDEDDG